MGHHLPPMMATLHFIDPRANEARLENWIEYRDRTNVHRYHRYTDVKDLSAVPKMD